MIESINISNAATFAPTAEQLNGLSQFNFLFGSNGSGKTTISRVIADETNFPTCEVNWKAGTKLQSLVYNPDFVERNFHQVVELKGVFTLGEKQKDILEKIATVKCELDLVTSKIETLTHTLNGVGGTDGKKAELATLESDLKEKVWTMKQRLDSMSAQSAYKGYMGSKDSFRTKVLQELASNKASVVALPELEKKAESVFGSEPTEEKLIASIDTAKLLANETNLILKKKIIGKDDVDIAAMINKLGNSDWVREGRNFYDVNGDICPFCQQETTKVFSMSLNEYFDETFLADSKAIDTLVIDYATDAAQFQQQLIEIITAPSKFLDVEKLKAEKELLDIKISMNNQHLARKKKETSQVVKLEPLNNVFTAIKALIDEANIQASTHNKMVANLTTERSNLTAQIWRFALEELKNDLADYKSKKDGLDKAISALNEQIQKRLEENRQKEIELRTLEKQTTSIQPTIDGINALLLSFGFQGFKLAKSVSAASYKLVRSDGTDAKATLSEGEKTFVTFLYFYHLLKGSEFDNGMTTDRIVVFDDPVSSLDSDILFIVSSLIKGLFDEVRANTGHIKQIFVLTHNVYFHKEVTYNPKRKDVAMNEETFWIVRKPALVSKLEKHNANPIKTSYELLWAEVRKPERSNLSIQNTMRRILENYFKILGGIEFDWLCGLFDGKEKIICKSLCSWIHDGSHNAHDDLYVTINDSMVDAYLMVFKAIFEKSGHHAHYKMMMGSAE